MIPSRVFQSLSLVRSGVYFIESLPLRVVNRLFTHPHVAPPDREHARYLSEGVVRLFEQEARYLEDGIYDWRALDRENPWAHARSYLGIFKDGLTMSLRMRRNETKKFHPNVDSEGLPEYYLRNFHFQTDGYLSEASARRYDHQVEILFSGTGGAMRRKLLPILKKSANDRGRWLEMGCGTGSATRPVLATFPKARVVALDLSAPYLKVAQDRLRKYAKVDFIQGDGTELEFRDQIFDAVYSVYCLHELPAAERERFVREGYRVLKPGGVLIMADSLQVDDNPSLNAGLEAFPQVYHEPFYKNYTLDRLENLLERATGQTPRIEYAFFTKYAIVTKPN